MKSERERTDRKERQKERKREKTEGKGQNIKYTGGKEGRRERGEK
jgi:hypothetical protein